MFAKKNLLFLLINFIFLVLLTAVVATDHFKILQNEILVVDNQRLFNDFKMTVEAKKNGSTVINKLNYTIDSLQTQMHLTNDKKLKEALYLQILSGKENIQEFNNNFTAEETSKIWKRIHVYISEYSKANDCYLVLGSNSSGAVLYSHPKKDITNKVLNYINRKYEGFN